MTLSIRGMRTLHLGRWNEACKGSWLQTGMQGMRLGSILWIVTLIARLMAQGIRFLTVGWDLTVDHFLGSIWLLAILVVCTLTQGGRKRGPKTILGMVAVLLGITAHVALGLLRAGRYSGPWVWSFALGLSLPTLLPALFLLVPGEPVPHGRHLKRLIVVFAMIVILVPLATWYESIPYSNDHSTKYLLFGIMAVPCAAIGFFDPRAWFVPCVMVLGPTIPIFLTTLKDSIVSSLLPTVPFFALFILALIASIIFTRHFKKKAV